MKATTRTKHQLIWFFVSEQGTMMNSFAKDRLFAKMELLQMCNASHSGYLTPIATPIECGRAAYMIESNRYGTDHKAKFLDIPDEVFEKHEAAYGI